MTIPEIIEASQLREPAGAFISARTALATERANILFLSHCGNKIRCVNWRDCGVPVSVYEAVRAKDKERDAAFANRSVTEREVARWGAIQAKATNDLLAKNATDAAESLKNVTEAQTAALRSTMGRTTGKQIGSMRKEGSATRTAIEEAAANQIATAMSEGISTRDAMNDAAARQIGTARSEAEQTREILKDRAKPVSIRLGADPKWLLTIPKEAGRDDSGRPRTVSIGNVEFRMVGSSRVAVVEGREIPISGLNQYFFSDYDKSGDNRTWASIREINDEDTRDKIAFIWSKTSQDVRNSMPDDLMLNAIAGSKKITGSGPMPLPGSGPLRLPGSGPLRLPGSGPLRLPGSGPLRLPGSGRPKISNVLQPDEIYKTIGGGTLSRITEILSLVGVGNRSQVEEVKALLAKALHDGTLSREYVEKVVKDYNLY